MAAVHAQIIKINGKKEYVVLPYEEFLRIQEELEDYQDLRSLRDAKKAEKDAMTIGMAELKKRKGRSRPHKSQKFSAFQRVFPLH